MKKIIFSLFLFAFTLSHSQQPATSSAAVLEGLQKKQAMIETSLVKNLPFENIGPTVMSGRVTAIEVNPDNPIEFYVGYASGGVWYTDNNGTTFKPIFDSSPTQNVGSLTVDWKSKTIWVGTGEVNSSRSSYAGIGVLKSTDNGDTWENIGLNDSHHISRILVNPDNVNEIVVGVTGHLYSPNEERGIFKSIDGGKIWNRTLFVNNQTGIIELERDPGNFDTMYAAAWDKDRKAWNFRGDGSASGIYKSTDGGSSWSLISGPGSGFPSGDGTGRIGLAVYNDQIIYAIHDNQNRREPDPDAEESDDLQKDDFKSMGISSFLELDDEKLEAFLRNNRFQDKYSASSVKAMVRSGTVKPIDLARYLEDANTLLFDTPVIGAEIYKSTDGGKSWKNTHDDYLDGIYYSYGYYFGKIHVDPSDSNAIYIYGVPILKSKDGGKSFEFIGAENVHVDHHALWINPRQSGHLIDGNDGGINISYDDGENWIKNNSPSVGQFYTVNVDYEKPYNVYGGLQDNGVWTGSHRYSESKRWHQSGHYPYESIMGGDGMYVEIDRRDSNIIITGFQFGNYFRINRKTDEREYIQPKHELGETPYRFNWQTPVLLSVHNQDILYLGGNKLMRSLNQGDDWEAISGDLTHGGKPGNVAYGTITSISESPFKFGLLYAGSDDGLLHVSKNGGGNWINISKTFPKDLWVSRVVASGHKKERVYVSLNGYRWDDFKPYIFKSDDYGQNWTKISSNLPISPVNVIREDPENENILYVGTDNGVYVSLDRGSSWQIFSSGLPNVAFHDLVIQREAKDLVLGTHGRSIYRVDIELLQQLKNDNMNELLLAGIDPLRASGRWGSSFNQWSDPFEPEVSIQFYSPANTKTEFSVETEDGLEVYSREITVDKGINVISYNVSASEKGIKTFKKAGTELKEADNGKFYLVSGEYIVKLKQNVKSASIPFTIK